MRISTIMPAILLFLAVVTHNVDSQSKIPLLSGKSAPGATGNNDVDIPYIEIYQPNASVDNGSAILMVPGGSYGTIVISEAQAARNYWLPKGFVVVVLTYRIVPYKYPVPMGDIKRAMRLVRSMAKNWNVNDNRIGVLGCSAGGHLASYLATYYDMGDPQAVDSIDQLTCKPDFCIFVYPVITMDASFTHAGSRSNLLGNTPSMALIDSLSNEKQVTEDTPPTFLVHGTVDNVVPWRNSQEFYDACMAHQVKVKFYKITSGCGVHGFGYTCDNWADTCFRWLKTGGYLDATTILTNPPEHPGLPVYSTGSNNDDYMIFDLSGNVITLNNHVPFYGSMYEAKSGRCSFSNGAFIVAKKLRGRYYPVGKNVFIAK